MPRYVDVDKQIARAYRLNMVTADIIKVFLDAAPTVDVREVVHGKWISQECNDYHDYYTCSICGEPWTTLAGTPQDNEMNFCPVCGADMRGEG